MAPPVASGESTSAAATMDDLGNRYAEASITAVGFFWKAGWAFVLGYAISAMIQAFVPRRRLARHLGDPGLQSIGLATLFGALSSSCSFAALATARSLIGKGAHFVAAVAFMFASTNLVVELGVLILVFLGWQYLVAELIGGVVLIAISAALIRLTAPARWIEAARERVEEATEEQEAFDPWRRIASAEGWRLVGHHFVGEWKMVWREILVGFTIAGFMKVFVPEAVWRAVFLLQWQDSLPAVVVAVQNALVAPLVAALTFIGSMGNIPLAAVLAGSGASFAGIMAFIYSDLMVPPLVRVNARYYGWRVALYVAAVMYASAVLAALLLHLGFTLFAALPRGATAERTAATFALDYTFWLDLAFLVVAGALVWLHLRWRAAHDGEHDHGGERGRWVQNAVTALALVALAGGLLMSLF